MLPDLLRIGVKQPVRKIIKTGTRLPDDSSVRLKISTVGGVHPAGLVPRLINQTPKNRKEAGLRSRYLASAPCQTGALSRLNCIVGLTKRKSPALVR